MADEWHRHAEDKEKSDLSPQIMRTDRKCPSYQTD